MGWLTVLFWLIAVLSVFQWRSRWRLVGGVTVSRWMDECRRARDSASGVALVVGVFSLASFPFAVAFDFMPTPLIPLVVPLAITAILGTTGPVTFLVLGPSSAQTADICFRLSMSFPLLRPGAALNPMTLGAIADNALGPSGNLWRAESCEPWISKIIGMIEDAPLVVFDGREITPHTLDELFFLLMSPHLSKVVAVGPVGEPNIARFLNAFRGIPVVGVCALSDVMRAPTASRSNLLKSYEQRRRAIRTALIGMRSITDLSVVVFSGKTISLDPTMISLRIALYVEQFRRAVPDLISRYHKLD